MLRVKCKKTWKLPARNSGGSVPIALCGRKCTTARRQFLYLLNNYIFLKVQKDDVCHLSPDNHEQLKTFVKLLTNPEPTKSEKWISLPACLDVYFFINKRYVYNQCCDTYE